MTREILVINPRRKKRTTTKKRRKTTAKRTKRRTTTMPRRRTRRKTTTTARRNPAPRRRRRTARRVARRAGSAAVGTARSIKEILKDAPFGVLGMLAAKLTAKLGGAGATETDPASWGAREYLQGAAGAVGAGFLLSSIRNSWGKEALRGGLYLMLYKIVQNELIANSPTATTWLGQDDELEPYYPTEYMGMGQDQYVPGNVYPNSAGEPYLLGQDGNWYPIEETHRLPEETSAYVGDDLVTPGPLGDELVPVTALGKTDAWDKAFLEGEDPYRAAFF